MNNVRHRVLGLATLAIAFMFAGAVNTFAQGTNKVANGQQVKKFRGVVTKREGEMFMMGDTMGGAQTVVIMTASTEVKSHKQGIFKGSKNYGQTYVLRGLRLEVDGVGNSEGQLVADKIRFDEQDLRTAQALKSTLDPVEAETNAKLKAQQEESERLAGQLAETTAVANQARVDAKKAQDTADYANNRINGLDDYDPIKTVTVYFNTNSSVLGPKAKAAIDEAAAWVKEQPDKKGWVVAVIGYADATGNTARNRTLSEARANNVIYYLVTKHKMPMQRLVQPFGYGQLEPAAENKTASGRAKNRRVEIRLMRNKGISGNVGNGN
jgi:OOP family OmpA-OmpF porin